MRRGFALVRPRRAKSPIAQVSQAIQQMEKVTQTTAATAEESAAASEELNAQAEASMSVVRDLEALVGGASAAHTLSSVRPQAKRAGGGVPMRHRVSVARRSAENEIPMSDTSTFGKF